MKTKINYLLTGAVILTALVYQGCSKSDSKLPAINGYDKAGDVASDNLLAYWTFDGTTNESISSTAPSVSKGNSFATGVKGQALKLAKGYLLFPTITKLSAANAFPSVTVSAWINVDNTGSDSTQSIFAITQSTEAQTDWNTGPVNMYTETNKPTTKDDTLVLHSSFSTYSTANRRGGDNINDYGVRGTDFQTVKGTNKWVHYVMVYDGVGSNIDLYANGVRVSNNNFRNRKDGDVGIGVIVSPVPTQVLIGGFPNAYTGFPNSSVQGWQGKLTGSLDEIRVYSKALSELEIGSLYALELAGR
jgi:hypothetical protein